MIAEPLTAMMCCPADDGAACVIVAREDSVRRPPARPAARAAGASALQSETLLARPRLPRAGRRTGDDDARHRPAGLRGGRPRSRGREPRAAATTRSSTRSSSTTSCSGSAPRATARAGRRGRDGARRPHPVQHRRRAHRPRPSRRADGCGDGPRDRARSCGARPVRRQVDGARVALAHLVGGGSVCTVNLLQRRVASPTLTERRTQDDERARANRDAGVRSGPAVAGHLKPGRPVKFPAARLAPDFYDQCQQSAFGDLWARPTWRSVTGRW